MIYKRLISRLDIKNENLVKGICYEGLRVLGDPKSFAQFYYEDKTDELLILDAVASLYKRPALFSLIKEFSSDIFVPITVGGGIRSLSDISSYLKSGADKVAINSFCFEDKGFLESASKEFGSSTIVASISVKKDKQNGNYCCMSDNSRTNTGAILPDWIKHCMNSGVGEILITSIDRDGTQKGFDEDILRFIPRKVNIPIVLSGGISSYSQILTLLRNQDLSGLAIGTSFHNYALNNISTLNSLVNNGSSFQRIQRRTTSLPANISNRLIKDFIHDQLASEKNLLRP